MADPLDDELLSMAYEFEQQAAANLAMAKRLRARVAANTAVPAVPDWMSWAREEMGVQEVRGKLNNERIEYYHGFTAAGSAPDEVPWCSSFVCAAMTEHGHGSTRSKAAKSWAGWGDGIRPVDARLGDILVFKRPGGHHVGFFDDQTDDQYYVLGGNQSNSVCVKPYPKKDLLAIRRPV